MISSTGQPPLRSHEGLISQGRAVPSRSSINPNKTIESISARQTSAEQSEHDRERVTLLAPN
jgi:hypothetical protein